MDDETDSTLLDDALTPLEEVQPVDATPTEDDPDDGAFAPPVMSGVAGQGGDDD